MHMTCVSWVSDDGTKRGPSRDSTEKSCVAKVDAAPNDGAAYACGLALDARGGVEDRRSAGTQARERARRARADHRPSAYRPRPCARDPRHRVDLRRNRRRRRENAERYARDEHANVASEEPRGRHTTECWSRSDGAQAPLLGTVARREPIRPEGPHGHPRTHLSAIWPHAPSRPRKKLERAAPRPYERRHGRS